MITLKSLFGYAVMTLAVSPIFNTLTSAVSTNTIHAMALTMLCVSTLTYNYFTVDTTHVSVISLNSGTFAVVCLASRLEESFDAFVLMWTSMLLLALWPAYRLHIRVNFSWKIDLLQSAVSVAIAGYCVHVAAPNLSTTFAATCVMVFLILPCVFYRMQFCKKDFSGPWDLAVPSQI
eukprot:m.19759 g.19759  ORF g.19759 m.19759 type:complete len:177 (+) comp11954_c0_seq1:799-1329(+)